MKAHGTHCLFHSTLVLHQTSQVLSSPHKMLFLQQGHSYAHFKTFKSNKHGTATSPGRWQPYSLVDSELWLLSVHQPCNMQDHFLVFDSSFKQVKTFFIIKHIQIRCIIGRKIITIFRLLQNVRHLNSPMFVFHHICCAIYCLRMVVNFTFFSDNFF